MFTILQSRRSWALYLKDWIDLKAKSPFKMLGEKMTNWKHILMGHLHRVKKVSLCKDYEHWKKQFGWSRLQRFFPAKAITKCQRFYFQHLHCEKTNYKARSGRSRSVRASRTPPTSGLIRLTWLLSIVYCIFYVWWNDKTTMISTNTIMEMV